MSRVVAEIESDRLRDMTEEALQDAWNVFLARKATETKTETHQRTLVNDGTAEISQSAYERASSFNIRAFWRIVARCGGGK